MKMAKTKKNNGKSKGARRAKAPRIPRGLPSTHHADYARLLTDPCSAPLPKGVYTGEQGMISRFVSDTVVNTPAGFTSGCFIYHPASGMVHASGGANGGTSTTLAYGTSFTPGFATTNAVAAKQRALAAVITAFASGASMTNCTGEIAAGVCSLDTLANGLSITFDQLFQLASIRGPIERRSIDIKWYPNTLDDKYSTSNTLTGVDASDTNVVFFAYRGYPAAIGLSVRLTGVIEWTPKINIGTAVSNNVNPSPVNHHAVVAAVSAKHPSWWHNVVQGITSDAEQVVRYVARAGMSRLGQSAATALLTM